MRCASSEVSVWHVDLAATSSTLLMLEAETPRLSVEETERAARFAEPVVGERWLAAHIALRLALERALGTRARRVAFSLSPRGKPGIVNMGAAGASSPLGFSLSHTKGHALIAIGAEPIGVDIEGDRVVRIEASRRYGIEAAGARLSALPLPDGAGRFLQAWVRLEAAAKADGSGMASMLTRAGVYGGRRGQGVADDLLPAELQVSDVALGPGLYGAVATERGASGFRVDRMPEDRDALAAFALGQSAPLGPA